jgi:protein-L-isoaspartate(D-aspartate) O-methyltransferase
MAWTASSTSNAGLVANLKRVNLINSKIVENAMLAVDRGNFCDHNPYADSPQKIGYNATISAPHMHAQCLELLKDVIKDGCKILDVGHGSGYLAACLAMILKQNNIKGKVFGIEHVKELVKKSIENVRKANAYLIDEGYLDLREGDGFVGLEDEAPFDGIHVGAAAEEIPPALIQQLRAPGRLIIPVGPAGGSQWLMQVDKDANGHITKTRLEGVSYVPLTTLDRQLSSWCL